MWVLFPLTILRFKSGCPSPPFIKCADSLLGLDPEQRPLSESPVSGLLSGCSRRTTALTVTEKDFFIHK